MKQFFSRSLNRVLILLVFLFAVSLVFGVGVGKSLSAGVIEAKGLDKAEPHVQAAMAVQNRHTPELMSIPEVVGTATGVSEAGMPAILVLTRKEIQTGVIPDRLEGVPVVVEMTGEFLAMKAPSSGQKRGRQH